MRMIPTKLYTVTGWSHEFPLTFEKQEEEKRSRET